MPYLKKIYPYRNGTMLEVEKVHSNRYGDGTPRQKRRKPTPEEVKKNNMNHAIRVLTRKIRANFTEEDWHMTLTYRKDARPDIQEAHECLKTFLKDARREFKKAGYPFKYIAVTEYQNQAIHHHIVINEIPQLRKIIKSIWTRGMPNYTPLYDDGDVKGLAEYLIKETEKTFRRQDTPFRQRYSCSRNLITPEPEIEIVPARTFSEKIRAPKGWYIQKNSEESGVNQMGYRFQRYLLVKGRGEMD